jgi:glycosyltransferase involved in cell wall biosynthesis
MKVSVVMAVYNERRYIDEIIRRIMDSPIEKELIIVDDCSNDGTRDRLEEIVNGASDHIRVFYHSVNRGKGAALRTGFTHTTGEVVIVQDADLEYDPAEYPMLIDPIAQGKADVVYGLRFVGGEPHRVLYFWHSVGNKCLTLLSNMLTNLAPHWGQVWLWAGSDSSDRGIAMQGLRGGHFVFWAHPPRGQEDRVERRSSYFVVHHKTQSSDELNAIQGAGISATVSLERVLSMFEEFTAVVT